MRFDLKDARCRQIEYLFNTCFFSNLLKIDFDLFTGGSNEGEPDIEVVVTLVVMGYARILIDDSGEVLDFILWNGCGTESTDIA